MAETLALEEMGEDDVLTFAEQRAQTIREAEADLLRAAYQWAVLHHPARLDPATAALPGRERARRLAGDGTPEVTEFAAAQFGAGSAAPPTPPPSSSPTPKTSTTGSPNSGPESRPAKSKRRTPGTCAR